MKIRNNVGPMIEPYSGTNVLEIRKPLFTFNSLLAIA